MSLFIYTFKITPNQINYGLNQIEVRFECAIAEPEQNNVTASMKINTEIVPLYFINQQNESVKEVEWSKKLRTEEGEIVRNIITFGTYLKLTQHLDKEKAVRITLKLVDALGNSAVRYASIICK